MIKILVADIHPVVRLGVKQILSGVQDIEVIDESGTEQELLNKAERNNYDIIIFEIDLPAGNGLSLLRELKKKKPKTALLIFTSLPEDQFAVRALKMGAAGYLSKQSAPEDFINTIHKIAQGKKYISADLAELLANNLDLNLDKPIHENLSDREYQVLTLTVSGKRQTEIAKILSLTKTTINTYQNKIRSKMKVSSNSELVQYAVKNNLAPQDD